MFDFTYNISIGQKIQVKKTSEIWERIGTRFENGETKLIFANLNRSKTMVKTPEEIETAIKNNKIEKLN